MLTSATLSHSLPSPFINADLYLKLPSLNCPASYPQCQRMEDRETAALKLLDSASLREAKGGDDDDRATSAVHQDHDRGDGDDGDDDSSDDFEFAFVIKDPESDPAITADEMFSNGQIRPIYPVFGRSFLVDEEAPRLMPPAETSAAERLPLKRLMLEERNSSITSTSTPSDVGGELDLDGVPPETYCVWTPGSVPPSPERCQKSGSTGSLVRWRRISDLVIRRSHSDGKEKFVFLAANGERKKKNEEKEAKGKGKGGKVTEVDVVTAHRVYYGKTTKGGGRGGRQSFLPYRQDLVGLFANVNVFSRSHHSL
ncbi:uncharacterized protein [Typha latifolia]|uniref:uncharacterized protein n=1 Tax=Typha latifolia TaxID=4733 RepID=UPI003C30D768